jgi:hypothetical protein
MKDDEDKEAQDERDRSFELKKSRELERLSLLIQENIKILVKSAKKTEQNILILKVE